MDRPGSSTVWDPWYNLLPRPEDGIKSNSVPSARSSVWFCSEKNPRGWSQTLGKATHTDLMIRSWTRSRVRFWNPKVELAGEGVWAQGGCTGERCRWGATWLHHGAEAEWKDHICCIAFSDFSI